MVNVNGEQIQRDKVDKVGKVGSLSYLLFKFLLKDSGMSLKGFVELWNKSHPDDRTTTQSLSNKLARDTLRLNEFLAYTEMIGYSLYFEKIGATKREDEAPKVEAERKTKKFADAIMDGLDECTGVNFSSILIAGENATEAARWISDNQVEGMAETQELILLIAANRQFHVVCKPISNSSNYEMVTRE